MKFTHKIVVAGICLGAVCSTYVGTQKSSASWETASLQTQLAVKTESGLQESTVEPGGDWLEAHESNGPEGVRGAAMQRMSLSQFGLVLAIWAAGGALAALTKKTIFQANPQDNEQKRRDSGGRGAGRINGRLGTGQCRP